jgi:SpoVK/Ycf46/Vps4 family AAA+-type ATPase
LNIKQVEPVSWNKKAFDRLVLDNKSKELINALVSVHVSEKRTGDIISGKGKGLIILLHGSPGVGKTLTAERYVQRSRPIRYQAD